MGFWHSFGTGNPGRGQGPICLERWIRQARRFNFVLYARRDAAAAIFQKALRGPLTSGLGAALLYLKLEHYLSIG